MPTITERVASVEFIIAEDADPDLSWLEQPEWNEATESEPAGYGHRRIAAYGTDWQCVGVRAVVITERGTLYESPGLWGVEYDYGQPDEDYLREIALEELAQLASDLGVDYAALAALAPERMRHTI